MAHFEALLQSVKNTVGYAEAENKDDFLAAARVGLHVAIAFYTKEVDRLQKEIISYKQELEETLDDFKTLAHIISKYSSDND